MKLVIFASLFIVQIASAHVAVGVHKGKTANGVECSFNAGATYFENNKRHPLNERIKIQMNGTEFVVQHPAVVDAAQSLASFNHDLFQGVLATNTGAQALVVDMIHSEQHDGPVAFTLIENNWKKGSKSAFRCFNLSHQH